MDVTMERRSVATVLGALGLVGGVGLLTTLLLGGEQAPARGSGAHEQRPGAADRTS